ncbi:MAG: DNA alkylation repair protein [Prolixibacteraceae bacterium]
MTIPEIVEAIILDLTKYADPERKKMMAGNHPTSMETIGLKVPNQRKVIEQWRKILAPFTEQEWIQLAIVLVDTTILECQQVAFEFIWKNKKALQVITPEQIFALGKTLDNWVSVDMYCLCITGYCWRTGILTDSVIENWAKSENRWIRRTALVSTVPLNLRSRGGKGDVEHTLRICKMLVTDYDDMIVKAMSWALRELSKSDKQAVEEFLDQNYAKLHFRVKREVETKLRTGKKNGLSS